MLPRPGFMAGYRGKIKGGGKGEDGRLLLVPRGLSGEERATTYARTSALTHVPQSPPEKKRKEKRVFLFLFPSLSFRTAESGAGRRWPGIKRRRAERRATAAWNGRAHGRGKTGTGREE